MHLCSYTRLTQEPEAESRRIAAFLDLDDVAIFQPRPGKTEGFTPEEKARILTETRSLCSELEL